MKTTVDISDPLLREARRVATREGVTLRALIERGLHRIVVDAQVKTPPFKLRRATFKGKGLQPALRDASWEQIRALAYEDRGG
jgi:hypothetical protein